MGKRGPKSQLNPLETNEALKRRVKLYYDGISPSKICKDEDVSRQALYAQFKYYGIKLIYHTFNLEKFIKAINESETITEVCDKLNMSRESFSRYTRIHNVEHTLYNQKSERSIKTYYKRVELLKKGLSRKEVAQKEGMKHSQFNGYLHKMYTYYGLTDHLNLGKVPWWTQKNAPQWKRKKSKNGS